jgi:hypothetical protein
VAVSVTNSDKSRKAFWKVKMDEWQKSGQSQAQFCRINGLNPNTFSAWKRVLSTREGQSQHYRQNQKRFDAKPRSVQAKATAAPSFVKCEVEPELLASSTGFQSRSQQGLAAELTNASNSVSLRIFNGADQALISALLSVFSGGSSGF